MVRLANSAITVIRLMIWPHIPVSKKPPYLLLHGELPNNAEFRAFDEQLKTERVLPEPLYDIISTIADAHPMDVLRTAVSALAAYVPGAEDCSAEAVLRKGVRLTSQVPMIVAAHHRVRMGEPPVRPDMDLSHAANFLYMLQGEAPSENAARLMDLDLILHAEHGSNASSFTARVVTGTDANLHAAITAAIAALSGPAHGGAAENVMKDGPRNWRFGECEAVRQVQEEKQGSHHGFWSSGLPYRRSTGETFA